MPAVRGGGHRAGACETCYGSDEAFGVDRQGCRIRRGDGAQNFAILRRIALDLIKQEKSDKASVRLKRLKAG